MEYIQNVLKVLLVVFMYIAIIGIFMRVANYVGEQLGFGKFFLNLWQKVRKNKLILKRVVYSRKIYLN